MLKPSTLLVLTCIFLFPISALGSLDLVLSSSTSPLVYALASAARNGTSASFFDNLGPHLLKASFSETADSASASTTGVPEPFITPECESALETLAADPCLNVGGALPIGMALVMNQSITPPLNAMLQSVCAAKGCNMDAAIMNGMTACLPTRLQTLLNMGQKLVGADATAPTIRAAACLTDMSMNNGTTCVSAMAGQLQQTIERNGGLNLATITTSVKEFVTSGMAEQQTLCTPCVAGLYMTLGPSSGIVKSIGDKVLQSKCGKSFTSGMPTQVVVATEAAAVRIANLMSSAPSFRSLPPSVVAVSLAATTALVTFSTMLML